MKLKTSMAIASLLLLSTLAARAQTVTVTGCPVPGVEPRCLVIRGTNNVTYNISGARTRPNIGQRGVRLTGTVSRKVSYCQQGIVLDNISWSYTDQRCSQ